MTKAGKLALPVLILFCALGGCALVAAEQATQDSSASETEVDENLIVVGFSEIGWESDWRIAHSKNIRESLSEENGFYLIYEDAQQKIENQLKSVRNFILQEVDYIVLVPIVVDGWDAVLEEAKEAGIPVILDDRQANVDEDMYTCWIGSDMEKEGETAGEWLAEYLKEAGRGEEEINIVTLQGTLGASAQIGRTEGFANVMEKHKNWKMLDMQTGDFTETKGREVMEDFLEKYDDIDVVVSENDNMTFGAIDAIKNAGKTCGPDGDIIVLSFDAVRAALEAMQDGNINAVFECNPNQGETLANTIKALERGEEVDKIQYVEETYFDTSMDLESILKNRAY